MRTAVVVVAAQCGEGVNEFSSLIVVGLGEEHVACILPCKVVRVHSRKDVADVWNVEVWDSRSVAALECVEYIVDTSSLEDASRRDVWAVVRSQVGGRRPFSSAPMRSGLTIFDHFKRVKPSYVGWWYW